MGNKGEDKWLPHCLGHEATGTVLEVRPAVTKVKAGDKVVLSWLKGTGIEAGGAVYMLGRQERQRRRRHHVPAPRRRQREPADARPGRIADDDRGAARLRGADRHGRGAQRARRSSPAMPSRCSAPAASASTLAWPRLSPVRFAGDRHRSLAASRRELARRYGATHVIDPDRRRRARRDHAISCRKASISPPKPPACRRSWTRRSMPRASKAAAPS